MWIPWAWALAAFLLAAGGAAVTALRSSLLIVGEEGLGEGGLGGRMGSSLPGPPLRPGEPVDAGGEAHSPPDPAAGGEGVPARAAGGSRGRKAPGPPRPTPVRQGVCPRGPFGHPFRLG